jgi:transposase InsO family protein
VQRLMRSYGIQGAKRRGKSWRTTKPDLSVQRRPDLVNRNFSAEQPNRLWVGDLSYLRCWEGVAYFAFVIDVFRRRVVGWQLASHMRTDLVLDALRMALGTREHGAEFRLVAHSDRGSQYTSADYTQVLDEHRVLASVGSVGDAYDNAMAESFLDSFKTELIADRVWRTKAQSSSPSSNTSAGSTTTACTKHSATSHASSSRPSPLYGSEQSLDEQQSEPTNPVSVEPGPAQKVKWDHSDPRSFEIGKVDDQRAEIDAALRAPIGSPPPNAK